MVQTAANILLAPAIVYYAPVGETRPADSVAAGTAWGGNWVEVGYTKEALTWGASKETYEVAVQQSTLPVKRVTTAEAHTFETVLSEITAANLQLALMGTATTTPAGASQVGKDELAGGGEVCLDERAWGFEGVYCDTAGAKFPVRVFIHRGTSVINAGLVFSKDEETGISLMVSVLEDTSQAAGERGYLFQRVTAAATS